MKIKQNFTYYRKDGKIFGCSFKKAPNEQYFGWITEYPNKESYNKLTTWTDYKNIPLETEIDNSKIALLKIVETL